MEDDDDDGEDEDKEEDEDGEEDKEDEDEDKDEDEQGVGKGLDEGKRERDGGKRAMRSARTLRPEQIVTNITPLKKVGRPQL